MRVLFPCTLLVAVLGTPGLCFAQWFGWGGAHAQPGQPPPICDPQRAQPPSPDDLDELLDKLRDGDLKPAVWQACAEPLLARVPPPLAAEFIDRMGKTYRKLLRNRDLDQDSGLQEQLHTLQQIYLHRPTGLTGTQEVMNKLLTELSLALAKNKLGPTATRYGRELLSTIDLERGQWQGAPVDAAALDRIYAQKDEKLLLHFSQRLPDAAIRREARRRIVRLHLAAIPYPELRARSAEVEEVVLAQGRYPLPLAQFSPVGGTLDPQRLVLDGAVLRQDLYAQTVAILAHSPSANFLGEIALRGALQIQVQGLAQPVTVCGPGGTDSLDPTPCIAPQELRSATEFAQVGPDGVLRLIGNLPMPQALLLATPGATVAVTLLVGNTPVYSARWGVRFDNPKSFLLQPAHAGQMGPNLDIQVDTSNPARLIYRVADGSHNYVAVVERDSDPLRIGSQGGIGQSGPSGHPGHDGRHGRDGRFAHCPSTSGEDGESGGDGGDGGPGGNGGPGGDGGNVRVRVLCGGKSCEGLVEQLRDSIVSLPGPGGEGGSGGSAGSSGRGGTGGGSTSCGESHYTLPAGRSGERGRSGIPGPSGQPGRDGAPGRVSFQVAP